VCIFIAVDFVRPWSRLSSTVAAGAMRSASGGFYRFAAIETNGILRDMLLFSPGRVSLDACPAIHY